MRHHGEEKTLLSDAGTENKQLQSPKPCDISTDARNMESDKHSHQQHREVFFSAILRTTRYPQNVATGAQTGLNKRLRSVSFLESPRLA